MTFTISQRKSFSWLPDPASEPTHTFVISSNGWFIDVRFNKPTDFSKSAPASQDDYNTHYPQELSLDWAFAGRKEKGLRGPNSTRFVHLVDSRTQNPSEILDEGISTVLPNDDTLETGSMINPATGLITPFEEVWADEEVAEGILISTSDHTQWRARAGPYEVAIGRNGSQFWAWFAIDGSIRWFSGIKPSEIKLLGDLTTEWKPGHDYEWNHESWHVYAASPHH